MEGTIPNTMAVVSNNFVEGEGKLLTGYDKTHKGHKCFSCGIAISYANKLTKQYINCNLKSQLIRPFFKFLGIANRLNIPEFLTDWAFHSL